MTRSQTIPKVLATAFIIVSLVPVASRSARATSTAGEFALPMPDFKAGSYEHRTLGVGSHRHLGEDHAAPPLTPVRAIANGHILPASGAHCNFGMVVVIEHTLPDGSKVVSISGHLSNREGHKPKLSGDVVLGEIIGYVAHSGGTPPKASCKNDDENGDGGPHLHLGLRLGGAASGWAYYGYATGSEDTVDHGGKFTSASAFIAAHQHGATSSTGASACTPRVDSVSAGPLHLGSKATFTVGGSCLPQDLAFFVPECAGLARVAHSPTKVTFACTPSYSRGHKHGVVKTHAHGDMLREFDALVK